MQWYGMQPVRTASLCCRTACQHASAKVHRPDQPGAAKNRDDMGHISPQGITIWCHIGNSVHGYYMLDMSHKLG